MSKDTEWSGWWQGNIVYTCDGCHKTLEYSFSDQDEAKDYDAQRQFLKDHGWFTTKVNGQYCDFHCEACRNAYIRKNTI